ncbi:MAG: tyrosine-type recombinase/integrase [Deltaproteobacteria bacterium]|nr:tyrosine-type recombinase/integrase [Deltaproteobacteria bacterium]
MISPPRTRPKIIQALGLAGRSGSQNLPHCHIPVFFTHWRPRGKATATISCYGRDLSLLLAFAGDIDASALNADLLAGSFVHAGDHDAHGRALCGEARVSGRIKGLPPGASGRYVQRGAAGARPRSMDQDSSATSGKHQFSDAPGSEGSVSGRRAAGETAERDLVMLRVLLGTGIRLAELVGLDIADIHLDQKQLRIRRAKGGSLRCGS